MDTVNEEDFEDFSKEALERMRLAEERSARAHAVGYPGDSPDEYRETPPSRATLHWDRVYLGEDGVAHLMGAGMMWPLCRKGAFECCVDDHCCCRLKLPADASYETVNRALDSGACGCPHEIGPDEWMGTGSQDEHDHAAGLPLCTGCFAARERQLPDPRLGTGHDQEMT